MATVEQQNRREDEVDASSSKADSSVGATEGYSRPVTGGKRTWKSYFWDTLDYSPAERRMMFKLDSTLLTFGTIGMFIKFLDTNNITNAYVSGMKESLNMQGNEYNYIQTSWTVGYIIGQVPATVLLNKFSPRYFIPAQEIAWTIFTFALAGAKSWQTLAGLRFIVGFAEAGYWPSLVWLLGAWYQKGEMAKRALLLQLAVQVAPMFSGYLQVAANNGMNSVGGLEGWRWLFIINGIISFPLAAAAFFFLPDDPARSGTHIFTQAEVDIAIERNRVGGRAAPTPWTRAKIWRIVKDWRTILFCLYSTMSIIPFQVQSSLIFWLKKQPAVYSLTQVNTLPTVTNAIVAIFLLVFGWVSDGPLRGRRWPLILFVHLVVIALDVALYFVPLYGRASVRLPLYMFSAVGSSITPLVFAWMNELCAGDSEQRAFILSMSNTLKYSTTAWFPNIYFQQVHQPATYNGIKAAAVVGGFCVTIMATILFLSIKDPKLSAVKDSDEAEAERREEKLAAFE